MENKKNEAVRVTITIRPEVLKELDRMAEEWGTSRSGMITILTKLRVDYEMSELMAEASTERGD
jgi:metal-responsive CopG/Arc/MetJ family transcriptional regulator